MTTVQLASAFLFSVGFHTKKSLRGNAIDWYEILSQHLRCSAASRAWFANHIFFAQPSRFSEYLLECPSAEVSQAKPCSPLSDPALCLGEAGRLQADCVHSPLRSVGPGQPGASLSVQHPSGGKNLLQLDLRSGPSKMVQLIFAMKYLQWISGYFRH